ncbi:hypothetical protein B0H14DRAFT_3604059 [Mycena olivaceomarginata]|nr:hypothetical protein B0H14DRAFT_3604059 [Mycena olivaceomarginata]
MSTHRTPFDSTPGVFDTQLFIETQLRGVLFPGLVPLLTSSLSENCLLTRTGGNQGEVESLLQGHIRLDSDALAVGHANLQAKFRAAMAILGHNRANMVDCSDVIPVPKPVVGTAGKTMNDIEQACSTAPFPFLTADPGPATSISPV